MKQFYTKEDEQTLQEIRKALLEDGVVEVHNDYETFYGVGFNRWLHDGLADIPCEFEVLAYNPWEGYPWIYRITKA